MNIYDSLKAYELTIDNTTDIITGDLLSPDERNYISTNGNAFLMAVISDQSVKAEVAWSLPYKLSLRLGIADLVNLSVTVSMDEVQAAIKEKPALHRYPASIGRYLWLASEKLSLEYSRNASNIWNDSTASEIIRRLEQFKGISHKKANLTCLLLVRDFGLEVPDKEKIDIVYDIHIRRIFTRAGFDKKDTYKEITAAARKIYPPFPGSLTTPFWAMGREICRPTDPKCGKCPIKEVCESSDYFQ